MKRISKKALSIILACVITVSAPAAAISSALVESSVPTVYIAGQGYGLFKEKGNPGSEQIYPLKFDTKYITDTIEKLNPVFAEAVVTGDYTEYCNVICDAVEPIFAEIRFDNNGEPKDNSGVGWSWSRETLADTGNNGEYGLFDYNFLYDWRLDPYVVASQLSEYINAVREVTGSDKVNVVSRCLGCNIATAYLQKFGGSCINKFVVYAGVIEGAASCSKPFSGQISLNADGAERFAYDYFSSDELIYSFIKSSLSLLNKTYGLELALTMVEQIYNKVKADIVPRLLLMTYATFPSYWSMVSDADYDTAKQLVFGKDSDNSYALLIQKADRYHYNVKLKARMILSEKKELGTGIAIISKYGYQMAPVTPDSTEIADSVVELSASSLGATTSQLDKALSRSYIRKAAAAGTDKYISPDKQVDASTCAFPDNTWIIKGIKHSNFPSCIDDLIVTYLRHGGDMSINDYEQYPQYLVYDEANASIGAMQEDNSDVSRWNKDNLLGILARFIPQLIEVIRNYVVPIFKKDAPSSIEG